MSECRIPETVPCDLSRYAEYENELYNIFLAIYNSNSIYISGKPVKIKYYPPEYNERSSFYHLICEDYNHTKDENDRMPNIARCEKIKWPKYLIDTYISQNCSRLCVWVNNRGKHQNLLLYCPELDYVVVLSIRNGYYLLVTAYPIDRSHTRTKLLKEYNDYKSKQRP